MKKLSLLLIAISFIACKQGASSSEEKEVNQEPFPVTSFIEGQINQVDSFQYPTIKYLTENGKKDSALISLQEFDQIAQEFTHPDINSPSLREFYKETNFADQTIKAVTFNYSTENKDLAIQRVDVVVNASAVGNDKVRSIYMEKQLQAKDTLVFKKMYWSTDRNFQIITTKQVGSQPETTSILKVEWDK